MFSGLSRGINKSCKCGAISTNGYPMYCYACFTFTHPSYHNSHIKDDQPREKEVSTQSVGSIRPMGEQGRFDLEAYLSKSGVTGPEQVP
jgi:hypothetical protein